MRRFFSTTLLLGMVLSGLIGCSHYHDDFAEEPMIIYKLDVVDVTQTSATLKWQTSKKGTSEVYFKRLSSLEKFSIDETEVLSHVVELSPLFPDASYYCRVISQNEEGYRDEWQDIVFTTKPASDVPIPDTELE